MEPGEPLHETQSSKYIKDLYEEDLDEAKDLDEAIYLERQTNLMVKRPQSRD